ncbi:TetR/AcrR family transcriptional regulator [Clostridium sp. CX1]|uniref:TetR/AcrR family transcriptional regulator n=1 Tax=Clostridium tanneri TaxID=3037988 RepID=A0ABU4JQV4_9CLOT|nr:MULTISPECIES: TetR/AcrR family transcriptional regulator [unclassified Clostridium]MCT8977418.1 TetR/AcrR family transcriptional regulator [Clostridium sp. CX1]MDW8800537.1 TetR/AcrR family transcriptional regulator [Clostridium sp. A1-XYC3]
MKNLFISRRERIILGAVEIIDRLGLQGLSTKELAKNQGVTEGALYKHFKSKDEIILAVIEYYSHYDDVIIETIKIKELKSKEAIRFFIQSFAQYYENYPAITAIYNSYEFFRQNNDAFEKIKSISNSRSNFIAELVEEGKKSGEFSIELDGEMLSAVILGLFRETVMKWRMNECKFSLQEKVSSTLEMVFKLV